MSPKIDYFVRQSRQKVETSEDFDKGSQFHKFSQHSTFSTSCEKSNEISIRPI